MSEHLNQAARAFIRAAALQKSNSQPYYKLPFAEQVLDTIRECLSDNKSITWAAGGHSATTCYLKWRQARQYIIDHLPEQAELLDQVKVRRLQGIGVKFTPISTVVIKESNVNWRTPLVDYIQESAPGEPPFERVGIYFSKEDHEWIKNLIRPVADQFVTELSTDRIVIFRV